jgi:long-subunit fatty acid transport protein
MKKILLLLLAVLLTASAIQAQTDGSNASPVLSTPPPRAQQPFKSRLFGGGDLGLQFGTFTLVNLAPVVGYRINDKLGVGLGPIYTYVKDNSFRPSYETNMYGGRLFGQYRITENIMAYSEYQVVNAEVLNDLTFRPMRRNIPFLFVGGGYVTPIGQRSGLMVMVLLDLIQDPYSYYQTPNFRVGYIAGF